MEDDGDSHWTDNLGAEDYLTGDYYMVYSDYNSLPDTIKNYFNLSTALIVIPDKDALDILVPYLFVKVEQAQRQILYVAVVKKYKMNKDLARTAVDNLRVERKKFRKLYKTLAGNPINTETIEFSKEAEKFRDDILHGKMVKDADKGHAACSIFSYSVLLNEQALVDFGFEPFGKITELEEIEEILNKEQTIKKLKELGILPKENQ